MAYIVLGSSWTFLANHSKGGFLDLALEFC